MMPRDATADNKMMMTARDDATDAADANAAGGCHRLSDDGNDLDGLPPEGGNVSVEELAIRQWGNKVGRPWLGRRTACPAGHTRDGMMTQGCWRGEVLMKFSLSSAQRQV